MSRRWCLMAVAVAALAVTGLAAADDQQQKEKGNWVFVSAVMDGKEMPADELKQYTIVLTGTNYTVKRGDQVEEEGTYKVDRSKTPHWVERTATSGDHRGKTFLGICEEKDETMTACWGPPNGDRPTEFSSKPGSGHMLETLRRAK